MDRIRVLASFIALSLLVAWGDAWLARPSAQTTRFHTDFPAPSILDSRDAPRDSDIAPPKFDVRGNVINDAVGDYRVDPQGEMYERHSPDVEVKKLRPAVG